MEERIIYLLEQYQAGGATLEELQELSNILKTGVDDELFRKVLTDMMQREAPVLPEKLDRWQQIVSGIVNVDKHIATHTKPSKARIVRLYPWAGAAAVMLLVVAGYFWLRQVQRSSLTGVGAATRENVISTSRGQQREVLLPDGTQVWLNAASSIRWSVPFDDRKLELSGEAFFDVRHAGRSPFLIRSGALTTTVLGTSFDVTAYPDQKNMIVSVRSGKVKVQAGNKILAILEKGRQLRVGADTNFYQKDIDTLAIAVWRTGDLLYRDASLEDIVADLKRTFKDSIEIRNAELRTTRITISFNKNLGLQNALEIICRTTDSRLGHKNGIFTIE